MIFSGHVSYYKCQACASEFSNITPSSLLPITAVVAFAAIGWSRVLSRVVPHRWLSVALGIIVSIASLWLIYALIEALTTRKLRRGVCPKCGGQLAPAGGGCYDNIVPEPWELIIYVLAVVLAFGAAALAGPGA